MYLDDDQIIELYRTKDERAVRETDKKYGRYCYKTAYNVLQSDGDAQECVNDTYLKIWNAIPPARPDNLKLFAARITRNLAIDRYRKNKRVSVITLVLDELADCTSGTGIESETERLEILKSINAFLDGLPPEKRKIFLDRYWSFDSIEAISDKYALKKGGVKMILSRIRKDLREHLKGAGLI